LLGKAHSNSTGDHIEAKEIFDRHTGEGQDMTAPGPEDYAIKAHMKCENNICY
jgi:hypothetical protein